MKTTQDTILKTLVMLILTGLIGLNVTSVGAQNYGRDDTITLYEHCDFRGDSRTLSVGDYRSMKSIDFGNDTVSSVRVPPSLNLTIYEDDKFRGQSARIVRDIRCFDREWNDKVSSLRVEYSNGDFYQGPQRDDDRRYEVPGYNDPNATGKNIASVGFANQRLQQISKKEWQLTNGGRGPTIQLQEVSRTRDTVYLQNNYTGQRVRIDLFMNDVTILERGGRATSYPIVSKQSALTPKPAYKPPTNSNGGNTVRGRCFNYKAYTRGGTGSVRFSNDNEAKKFSGTPINGRVCHSGEMRIEMGKRNPGTNVVLEINGRKYGFARNEAHDQLRNNWYRKFITINVLP